MHQWLRAKKRVLFFPHCFLFVEETTEYFVHHTHFLVPVIGTHSMQLSGCLD
jgi:hypothetical protein